MGQLRNYGVTLHLAIKAERYPVPDVPAIYFVEPTEENISRMVGDYKAGLYSYMHVNFSSSISTSLLKRFAMEVSQVGVSKSQISKVIDRHCSFVSLDQNRFSLNLPSTYLSLHQSATSDRDIESVIERVSEGLLSVILTTIKQVPVIRAPQNGAAGMVAQLLNDRLTELLKESSSSSSSSSDPSILLSSSFSASSDPSHAQRPLLIVLDRDADLSPMVAHGWSYAALMTDLLGMNLNKVSLPQEKKVYDIDVGENFWRKISYLPFPDAATKVNELVAEFSKIRGELTTSPPDDGTLSSAMTALPRVTEMKKIVDMHTTIATSLLNEIKARKTDKFVEIENDQTISSSFISLLSDPSYGSMDKVRTAIFLLLKKDGSSKIDQIISQLAGTPESLNALKYIKQLLALRGITPGSSTPPSTMLEGLAERMKSGMKNLKTMLPVNDNLLVTNTVQQLADQIANPLTDSFLYFDPRNPNSSVRVRGSFRQIIVCVVGGGCVSESENITAWSTKTARTVIYGATDFPNPSQFVADLAKLAK